jgi:hypothetical protein
MNVLGFVSFLTEIKSAALNESTHSFSPPKKELPLMNLKKQ